jgi:hypothetical protein
VEARCEAEAEAPADNRHSATSGGGIADQEVPEMENKMQRCRRTGVGSMKRGRGSTRKEVAMQQAGGIRHQWTRGGTMVEACARRWRGKM